MNQADITKLVSRLRYRIQGKRQMRSMRGPMGRLDRLRQSVTGLIKYERIELYYPRADESRGYAERVCFIPETPSIWTKLFTWTLYITSNDFILF